MVAAEQLFLPVTTLPRNLAQLAGNFIFLEKKLTAYGRSRAAFSASDNFTKKFASTRRKFQILRKEN